MKSRQTPVILDATPWDPLILWMTARRALNPVASFKLDIHEDCRVKMEAAAALVQHLAKSKRAVYGVNTGFGDFAERAIPQAAIEELQVNLIRSHACGIGEEVSRDLVMAMWLLRLRMLTRGHSGVRCETVEALMRILEAGILACIPSRGSVGASGDLHPSAHATLTALGEGDCTMPTPDGRGFERLPAAEALRRAGLKPLKLGAKEGLALINGTAYSTALAVKVWFEGCKLLRVADAVAAMTMEAVGGAGSILDDRVLALHHRETDMVGCRLASWLEGSTRWHAAREAGRFIQAPYSLRCVPQVHGAVLCELEQCYTILKQEIGCVNDNPLVFADDEEILSCGNFHAIYVARVSDRLASAMANLATISERRTNLLMDDKITGLPKFLVRDGGLNSGLMMLQTTAAALASEVKSFCMPSCVDSIPTNCHREDHVSMAAGAGMKALQTVTGLRQVLAIEAFCAGQATDLAGAQPMPPRLAELHSRIRKFVPFIEADCYMAPYLKALDLAIEADTLLPTEDLDRLQASAESCRAAVTTGVVECRRRPGASGHTSLMGHCPCGASYPSSLSDKFV